MNFPCRQTRESVGGHFELRFRSLFDAGRGLAFPCYADGRLDIDRLPARARANFLDARALIGRDCAMPWLRAIAAH